MSAGRAGVARTFAAEIPATTGPFGDLALRIVSVDDWRAGHGYYAHLNPFPPLTLVLFWPAWAIGLRAAAAAVVALTLVILAGLLAWQARRPRGIPGTWTCAGFLLMTGLVSYGLRFEFERGQYNVIATGAAWAGAVLASRAGSRWRIIAGVLLFTIGVQLKVYPAIFGLLLVLPLREWRSRLPLVLWTGILNLACLFMMGAKGLRGFLWWQGAIVESMEVSRFNGSAASFAGLVAHHTDAAGAARAIEIAVLLAAIGLAVRVMARADRPDSSTAMAALIVVALVAPPVSYDYKLSLLPWIGAGILLSPLTSAPKAGPAFLVAGVCYGSLLLGPAFRPGMGSSVPQLLLLLGCCAWIARAPALASREPGLLYLQGSGRR